MNRTALLALLSLTVLPACRPSFPALMASRRLADATCTAASQAQADALAAEVERLAEPRLHIHTVREEELVRAVGERGGEIARKVTLLRVRASAHKLPAAARPSVTIQLDDKQAAVSLKSWGTPGAEQAVSLFALTGEKLPSSYSSIDMVALSREVAWGIFTVGLKQLLFGAGNVTQTTAPGRDDYERQGPRAMAILDGLNDVPGAEPFLLPQPLERGAVARVSYAIDEFDEDGRRCALDIVHEIPLGAADEPLWQTTERVFGPQAPPVAQLSKRRSVLVTNEHGSWSSH